MAVMVDKMELPTSCGLCPLVEFIDQDDDHDAFYYCRLDNWKESSTPAHPMTIIEAAKSKLKSCPLYGPFEDLSSFNSEDLCSKCSKFGECKERTPYRGYTNGESITWADTICCSNFEQT